MAYKQRSIIKFCVQIKNYTKTAIDQQWVLLFFPFCVLLGTSCKGYALAHTQEGEEKKQTSGTSNTRGSRRKPAATAPTRRSTRNTRAEPVSQSQRSPVSNISGCDAPDNNNPSVSVSSSGESEKQTRQAPKRKSVRRGRKLPLLKWVIPRFESMWAIL